jgi:hypothetical protein
MANGSITSAIKLASLIMEPFAGDFGKNVALANAKESYN